LDLLPARGAGDVGRRPPGPKPTDRGGTGASADSEALLGLEARAAAERRSAEETSAARERKAARRTSRERSERERDRRRSRRAPTGFGSSVHAFSGVFGGVVLAAAAAALAMSGELLAWAPVLGAAAVGLAGYLGVTWLALSFWRSRLRFRLHGFDTIRGEDHTGERQVPWIAFEVRVSVAGDDPDTRRAVALALDVLASRVNRLLDENEEARVRAEQRWEVRDALVAAGESWKEIYISGLLRRWLSGEMNEVASTWPGVEAVRVDARYTGRSFEISTGTMS